MKDILESIISKVNNTQKANQYRNDVAIFLQKDGYSVIKEVKVPNRGDGRKGKIDIVAEINNEKTAIEIDWISPRKKSLFKLENFECKNRIVILRQSKTVIVL